MRHNPSQRIQAATSPEKDRPTLQHVRFSGRHLVASDGHILAVVPCTPEDGDTPGAVPVEALKAAGKGKNAQAVRLNGSALLEDGRSFPRPAPDFPPLGFVLRQAHAVENDPEAVSVTFDVDLLSRLCDALGTRKVRLTFLPGVSNPTGTGRNRVISVLPDDEAYTRPDGYGILMPLRSRL